MFNTVFITGANGGIGLALVDKFYSLGYNVVANCHINSDKLDAYIGEVLNDGKILELFGDIRNRYEMFDNVEIVKDVYGGIDVLINNAGIVNDKTFLKMKNEQWDEVITTNLRGTYTVTKAVAPLMAISGAGSIINISSIVAQRGAFGQSNYVASKAAIVGMTKTLAKELGPKGVRVNAIAPGYIDTEMIDAIPEEYQKKIIESIPLQRLGRPDEVADVAEFLARTTYVNGAVIDVNGGI